MPQYCCPPLQSHRMLKEHSAWVEFWKLRTSTRPELQLWQVLLYCNGHVEGRS